MKHWICLVVMGMALILLSACAGAGAVVALNLRAIPSAASLLDPDAEQIAVLVEPFEDLRPQQSRLGLRTHLGGGFTYFSVEGRDAAGTFTRVVGEYLEQMGWLVWVKKPGEPAPQVSPDVRITGQLKELSVRAKSRLGSTVITCKLKAVVLGVNAADQSTVSVSLEGIRTRTVLWFETDDVQELVNQTLRDSLRKLMADLKVVDRTLRLKRNQAEHCCSPRVGKGRHA